MCHCVQNFVGFDPKVKSLLINSWEIQDFEPAYEQEK